MVVQPSARQCIGRLSTYERQSLRWIPCNSFALPVLFIPWIPMPRDTRNRKDIFLKAQ